jgi:hypothetical protein
MVPIVPYLLWTGGVAAGASVAGGFVRGVGELVRGRPGAALAEMFDGLGGPVRLACKEIGKLGSDAYHAVVGRGQPELDTEPEPLPEPPAPAVAQRRRRSRPRLSVVPAEIAPSENGSVP